MPRSRTVGPQERLVRRADRREQQHLRAARLARVSSRPACAVLVPASLGFESREWRTTDASEQRRLNFPSRAEAVSFRPCTSRGLGLGVGWGLGLGLLVSFRPCTSRGLGVGLG